MPVDVADGQTAVSEYRRTELVLRCTVSAVLFFFFPLFFFTYPLIPIPSGVEPASPRCLFRRPSAVNPVCARKHQARSYPNSGLISATICCCLVERIVMKQDVQVNTRVHRFDSSWV